MNQQARRIVKQVLSEVADTPHFFDLSDSERISEMIARGYALGAARAKPNQAKRRAPNRPRGTSVQLTIQFRPQSRAVYSGRRK
jgi:hypothetical protein